MTFGQEQTIEQEIDRRYLIDAGIKARAEQAAKGDAAAAAQAARDERAQAEVISIKATEDLIKAAADNVAYDPALALRQLEQAQQRVAGRDLPQWEEKLRTAQTALRQAGDAAARQAAVADATATLNELKQAKLAANASRAYELGMLISYLESVIAKYKKP